MMYEEGRLVVCSRVANNKVVKRESGGEQLLGCGLVLLSCFWWG